MKLKISVITIYLITVFYLCFYLLFMGAMYYFGAGIPEDEVMRQVRGDYLAALGYDPLNFTTEHAIAIRRSTWPDAMLTFLVFVGMVFRRKGLVQVCSVLWALSAFATAQIFVGPILVAVCAFTGSTPEYLAKKQEPKEHNEE